MKLQWGPPNFRNTRYSLFLLYEAAVGSTQLSKHPVQSFLKNYSQTGFGRTGLFLPNTKRGKIWNLVRPESGCSTSWESVAKALDGSIGLPYPRRRFNDKEKVERDRTRRCWRRRRSARLWSFQSNDLLSTARTAPLSRTPLVKTNFQWMHTSTNISRFFNNKDHWERITLHMPAEPDRSCWSIPKI